MRIRKAYLENYRGFRGRHDLDLGADIVLLLGPNGFGKTSLLDGLNLALNGRDPRRRSILEPWSGIDEGRVHLEMDSGPCPTVSVHADGKVLYDEPLFDSLSSPDARCLASVFYQDELRHAVGPGARIPFELLRPPPQGYEELSSQLKDAKEALERARREAASQGGSESREKLEKQRIDVIRAFAAAWLAAGAHSEGRIPPAEGSEFFLILQNENLGKQWQSRLRAITTDLSKLSGLPAPSKAARPAECLARWVSGLDPLVTEELSRVVPRPEVSVGLTEHPARRLLAPLRSEFRDPGLVLVPCGRGRPIESGRGVPLPMDAESLRTVMELASAASALADDRGRAAEGLRELAPALSNMDGPDLRAVMTTIRTRGPDWLAWIERLENDPHLPLKGLKAWFAGVLDAAQTPSGAPDPLTAIGEWQESLRGQIVDLERLREAAVLDQERLARGHRVGGLLLQTPDVPELIDWLAGREQMIAGELLEFLTAMTTPDGSATPMPSKEPDTSVLQELRRAADQWGRLEERLERLDQAEKSNAAVALIEHAQELVQRELKKSGLLVEALNVSKIDRDELLRAINEVIGRFRVVNGMVPVRFETQTGKGMKLPDTWELVSCTGLSMDSLSSGQLAVLNVAWVLVNNLAFQGLLPHRVILLDDVTTSLDLAQLIPAANLFRQLAYSADDASRRQVILSSHHEDLTHRLLDFLVPPPGRTLKVIVYEDWSEDAGPTLRTFDVRPGEEEGPVFDLVTDSLKAQGWSPARDSCGQAGVPGPAD